MLLDTDSKKSFQTAVLNKNIEEIKAIISRFSKCPDSILALLSEPIVDEPSEQIYPNVLAFSATADAQLLLIPLIEIYNTYNLLITTIFDLKYFFLHPEYSLGLKSEVLEGGKISPAKVEQKVIYLGFDREAGEGLVCVLRNLRNEICELKLPKEAQGNMEVRVLDDRLLLNSNFKAAILNFTSKEGHTLLHGIRKPSAFKYLIESCEQVLRNPSLLFGINQAGQLGLFFHALQENDVEFLQFLLLHFEDSLVPLYGADGRYGEELWNFGKEYLLISPEEYRLTLMSELPSGDKARARKKEIYLDERSNKCVLRGDFDDNVHKCWLPIGLSNLQDKLESADFKKAILALTSKRGYTRENNTKLWVFFEYVLGNFIDRLSVKETMYFDTVHFDEENRVQKDATIGKHIFIPMIIWPTWPVFVPFVFSSAFTDSVRKKKLSKKQEAVSEKIQRLGQNRVIKILANAISKLACSHSDSICFISSYGGINALASGLQEPIIRALYEVKGDDSNDSIEARILSAIMNPAEYPRQAYVFRNDIIETSRGEKKIKEFFNRTIFKKYQHNKPSQNPTLSSTQPSEHELEPENSMLLGNQKKVAVLHILREMYETYDVPLEDRWMNYYLVDGDVEGSFKTSDEKIAATPGILDGVNQEIDRINRIYGHSGKPTSSSSSSSSSSHHYSGNHFILEPTFPSFSTHSSSSSGASASVVSRQSSPGSFGGIASTLGKSLSSMLHDSKGEQGDAAHASLAITPSPSSPTLPKFEEDTTPHSSSPP